MISCLAGIPTWVWVIIVVLMIGVVWSAVDIFKYNHDSYSGDALSASLLFIVVAFKIGVAVVISIAIAITKLLL